MVDQKSKSGSKIVDHPIKRKSNPLDHTQMIKRYELRVMFFTTQRIFCFEKSYLTMFGKNGWNGFSCSKEDMKSPIKLASTTWKLGKLLVLRRRETLEYGA